MVRLIGLCSALPMDIGSAIIVWSCLMVGMIQTNHFCSDLPIAVVSTNYFYSSLLKRMVGSIGSHPDLRIEIVSTISSRFCPSLGGVVWSIGFCPDLPNYVLGFANRVCPDLPIVGVRSYFFWPRQFQFIDRTRNNLLDDSIDTQYSKNVGWAIPTKRYHSK